MHRRDLLKAGLAGLPFLGLPRSIRALGSVATSRPRTTADARTLFIYLRGGADPLNMLVPFEDPGYAFHRGTIGLNPANLIKYSYYESLGFNPDLGAMLSIPRSKVAYLYRTGNFTGERSHFTEQHLTETGREQFGGGDAGWVAQVHGRSAQSSTLGNLSLSKRLQRLMLATDPMQHTNPLHLQTAYGLTTGMNSPRDLTIDYGTGSSLGIDLAVRDSVSKSLTNPTYAQTSDATYLRNTVNTAGVSLDSLRANLGTFDHDLAFPLKNGMAEDPAPSGMLQGDVEKGTPFFARLEEAVNLLTKQNGNAPLANCAAVELGGWDTHSNQLIRQPPLLRILAQGLKAAYNRLNADAPQLPFLIYVVTEFGRTVADNGSGTDHGVAGLTIAIGSHVNGGVWNAHSPLWSQPMTVGRVNGQVWKGIREDFNGFNGALNVFSDALDPVTDFRQPLAEICENYFQVPVGNLPAPLNTEWASVLNGVTPLGFV